MKKIITSFVALLSAVGCASFLRAAQLTYVVGVSDSNKVTIKDDGQNQDECNWVKYPGYSYYAFDMDWLFYNLGLVVSERKGYRFDGWYTLSSGKDGSGGPKDCDKKISTDLHITWSEITSQAATSSAWGGHYFVCPKFVKVWTVSASASPAEGGTVSGAGTVDEGASVTLTAKPNDGYAFDSWKGQTETSATLKTDPVMSNANFVAVFRELKVDKPEVTKSFTYDGNAKTCATAGDHYTVSDNVKTAAGTYTFTATLKDGYHWSDGTSDPYTVEWTIGKAENGFTDGPAITGWTYDGSPSSPTAVAKFSGSSGISYVYYDGSKVKLSGRPSDAGNYYLKATTPGTTDYASVTSDFVKFVIAPREINTDNVSFEDKTETYDGTSKKIVVPYFPDNVTVTYEGNTRTEAGSQTATANFSPKNANYTVSTKSKTATLTVAQATISSLALVESSVTYDGQPHPPIVMSVTTANGKTFTDDSVGWTVSYDRDDFVNAGEIKVSVTGNKNLTGTFYYPQTYTINRARTAEMSVSPVSMIYNGQPCEPVLTLTNCAEDPDSDSIATEPGTYYVRATPDANHAWSDGLTSSRSIRWTISYQKVTVHFDLNYDGASASSTRELNYMKGYEFSTPSRTGYDFKGWWTAKEGGTEVTTSTKVERSDEHMLYAHWKAKEYTLTITMETGHEDVRYEGEKCPYKLAAPLVYDATNLNELAVVSKEGYRFKGYYSSTGAQLYDANGHCVKDALSQYWDADWPDGAYRHADHLTVVARFGDPLVMCDVTTAVSPASAGTVTGGGTYEKGSNAVLVATENAGYSFAYWNRTNDNVHVSADKTYSFTVSSSAGYVAVFTGNVYTVTLRETGEKKAPTKTVTFGERYGTFPTYEDDDYEMMGWFTEADGKGVEITESTIVTNASDHELYAYWEDRKYFDVIYVDSLGKQSGNKTFTNRVERAKTPEITEEIAEAAIRDRDANWKTPDGYTRKGWDKTLPQPVVHGLTLTAQWASLADVLDYSGSDVAFDADWLGFWKVQEGGAKRGDTCLFLEKGSGNNTVTALVKKPGKLSFHWKASPGNDLRVKVGDDEPSFKGRDGMDWEETNVIIKVATAENPMTVTFSCPNQDLDAFCALDWVSLSENVPEYDVTVTSGGNGSASCSPTGPHHAGDSVTLTATAEEGYAFCCWTNDTGFATNENPWTFTVVEEVSYKATFTNAQYVVTLDPNGGTGGDTSVIATYLKPLPTLEQAQRPERTDGWTFNGYTNAAGVAYYDADGEGRKAWDQPNAATLFAQWKAPDEYALTVKVEGQGSVIKKPDAPQYVANTTVDLEAKPDIGAAFAQWDDGEKSPTRTVTMTGDITLTATFTNCQYVVTFDANGGSVTQKTTIVTYSKAYGTLPPPSSAPAGFEFVGWYTAATGGTKVESTTNVTTAADHTLYAHWEADVGPLSKALDCNNLKFEQTGGWEIGNDPTLGALNGTYVYTSTKDAILKATIEKSGTLTFHYKGYAVNMMTVQVLLGDGEVSDARINIKEQESYPDTWQSVDVPIQVTGDPVELKFKCTKKDSEGCSFALDRVTWTPDAPAHPEPTDEDKVTISAAGVKDGKFTLSFASDERFDYNLLTNANLLIDSWGKMEKKTGTGSALVFEPEIIDGLPQLFYKVETIQRQD